MFGEKALDLVREFHRNEGTVLGPYSEDGVRQVLEEMQVLYEANQNDVVQIIQGDSSDQTSSSTTVQIRHESLQRNKRCLLAYFYNRILKIRNLRWEFGSVLPPDIKQNMSEKENAWFKTYNKSLANYMRSIGPGGLDLTQNLQPPQSFYIEVRCLEDKGEYEFEDGSVVLLKKNSLHYLPRSNCEHLIKQGLLEHVT